MKGGRTMKEWSKERCSEKPEELQLIAPDTYIERKDIVAVEHEETEDMPAYTDYECMSREISVSEYNMIKSITEINTNNAIDAYTEELIKEGMI